MGNHIRITSAANNSLKKWRKLIQSRKARYKERQLLIEGINILEEARKHGCTFHALLCDDAKEMDREWKRWADEQGITTYTIHSPLYRTLMDTDTPQPLAAVIDMPTVKTVTRYHGPVILLDRIQDPGNLGTIIRTAAATGVSFVGYGKGTADPYQPKVVRAAAGALFQLTFQEVDLADWIKQYQTLGGFVVGTTVRPSIAHFEVNYPERTAFLLGNEGQGISEPLLQLTDEQVHIPLPGKVESLNVSTACAVLLYEYVRQWHFQ